MKIEITDEIGRKALDAYMRSEGMSFDENLNTAIKAVAPLIADMNLPSRMDRAPAIASNATATTPMTPPPSPFGTLNIT